MAPGPHWGPWGARTPWGADSRAPVLASVRCSCRSDGDAMKVIFQISNLYEETFEPSPSLRDVTVYGCMTLSNVRWTLDISNKSTRNSASLTKMSDLMISQLLFRFITVELAVIKYTPWLNVMVFSDASVKNSIRKVRKFKITFKTSELSKVRTFVASLEPSNTRNNT